MDTEIKKDWEEVVAAMNRLVLYVSDEIEPVTQDILENELRLVYELLARAEMKWLRENPQLTHK